MSFAQSERALLCDLFITRGPDAPTLCEGWTTYDLATHLWLREMDPLAAPGMFLSPLAGLTRKRTGELQRNVPFSELVAKLRKGPGFGSFFALPGVDEAANSLEYFVHHEDVRRAGQEPEAARTLDPETEDFLFKRLRLMGRIQFRRAKVGVVLEREDDPSQTIRVMPGTQIVTLIGKPSELTLYAFGRTSAAKVRLVGDDDAIDTFHGTDLAV